MRLIQFTLLLFLVAPLGAAPPAAEPVSDTGPQERSATRPPPERAGAGSPQKTRQPQKPDGQPTAQQRNPAGGERPPQDGATREAPENTLPEAFARFDLNGDGRLGPAESRAAREALKLKPSTDGPAGGSKAGAGGFASRTAAGNAQSGAGAGAKQPGTGSGTRASAKTGSSSLSRLEAARQVVAQARERRAARESEKERRMRESREARQPQQTPSQIYRSLEKYQPTPIASTGAGKGWAPVNRQGIMHGKKRGSEYYRSKISRGRRGGGRGGRGRNPNAYNQNNGGYGY